ncbi:MAG: hypothetical protein ACRDYZ_06250 [Acidimicrobiales bacterium]
MTDSPRPGPAAPWPGRASGGRRWWPAVATLVAIGGVVAVVLWQLHLSLLLSDTTTTGGDTGAHYMMPAFFNTNLFPHLTGWDPAWYDGYPIYTFYFVLPDVLTALAAHVIAYDIAFKLSTVLGSVLLPVAAWACGRLFGLRAPVPAALAVATLPFLFDSTWTIDGGNLFSTLAGEYAYSFSLVLALVFVGLVARGVRTGRHRAWASIVLALCILAHFVPALLALAGAGLLTLVELLPARWRLHDEVRWSRAAAAAPPRPAEVRSRWQVLWWSASTVVIGVLLSGWWLVPFGLRQPYTTAMGYTNVTAYVTLLFPHADLWALAAAGVAIVVAGWIGSRFGMVFAALGGLSAMALVVDPQGKLYDVRLLPLWFLCAYLMVGWLFGVAVVATVKAWRRGRLAGWVGQVRRPFGGHRAGAAAPRRPGPARFLPGALSGPLLALLAALAVVVPPFLPGVAASLPGIGVHPGANQVSAWASWNYTGYEGKADYPEYRGLMQLMARIGKHHGCGRAMWEYNADENRFGTPEALMLLPYWTGGCIDSMEGLLFESSATTPYHFLNQAELSVAPSEPVVGLPYGPLDVPLGVQHLQLLGVRYLLVASPQVEAAATADPTLRLLARSGPWTTTYNGSTLSTTWEVYAVAHSAAVVPLTDDPAVLRGVGPGQATWLGKVGPQGQPIDGPSVAWYQHPTRWDVELAAGGPPSWPRVTAKDAARAPAVPAGATTVTHVRRTSSSISFHVSHVGTPVLVKTSYFPNWHATGAEGPWRTTPNEMVVVPTRHDVVLSFGASTANRLGEAATALGVAALLVLGLLGWRRRARIASVPHAGHNGHR